MCACDSRIGAMARKDMRQIAGVCSNFARMPVAGITSAALECSTRFVMEIDGDLHMAVCLFGYCLFSFSIEIYGCIVGAAHRQTNRVIFVWTAT